MRIIFHYLKVLLDDFNFHNVEMSCILLESCGRFLFRNPETHSKMVSCLEVMSRKKTALNLDARYAYMIDNVIFECNPPDAPIQTKTRLPVQNFIRKLIYQDLNRSGVHKILKLLRRLDWNDEATLSTLKKVFSKIWKVRFSNIPLMAYLLAELTQWHPIFGTFVVDNTLEQLRLGLETNSFKQNQQRVAIAKYLGELYNYRMINSVVIFDALYFILRFGHQNGIPLPNAPQNHFDGPDDFFRLRLCCTILDACGRCFVKGRNSKRLDRFFVVMQVSSFHLALLID